MESLKLDIGGIKMTVRDKELGMNRLEGKITQLESGEEVQGFFHTDEPQQPLDHQQRSIQGSY